jgi:sortase A
MQAPAPVPPAPKGRAYIDWRGIGILVTTREFVDRLLGITGELLTTAGVFVLLFLGWHVGFNDYIAGIIQDKNSATLTQEWTTTSTTTAEFDRDSGNALGAILNEKTPITKSPAAAESFATIIIPRFGPHYVRTIAQSVDVEKVLNNLQTGVGHYTGSDQLGAIGNFALAGHRTTYGAPFGDMDKLRVGDRIYIETKAGWYVYRFRNFQWVYPNETDVLNAVPRTLLSAKDRILTMTSCHPKLSAAERIIGFSLFESFVPRDAGTPAEIVKMVGAS